MRHSLDTIQTSCFLSFWLIILFFIDGLARDSCYCSICLMLIFLFLLFLLSLWAFYYLFIQLFIYISRDLWIFILWIIIYYCYFVDEIVSNLAISSSFKLFICPFEMSLSFFRHILALHDTRYSSFILYFTCLGPGITHFSKVFLFEWYLETTIQVLSVLLALEVSSHLGLYNGQR